MKILFAHKNILPVKKYGGTERVLFWLMKELARQGHEVSLIGHPQSQVEKAGIRLIPSIGPKTQDDFRSLIPKDTQIIHLFYTPPWPLEIPCLVTIEGNGQPGEKFSYNTVFVSGHHAQRHGSNQFVYNGLDFEEYPFLPKKVSKWNHFLFLAKASWKVKNLHDCMKACRHLKKHLHIAGGRAFTLSPYIHSHGMVGQKEKLQIMQKTDALLFPVRWPEPFGIAMIEALSQGLPIIGSPYGSLPEIINPITGFICKDYASFQENLLHPPTSFNREDIRHYVEQNFSIQKMADDYERLYLKILEGKNLNLSQPVYTGNEANESLLPF